MGKVETGPLEADQQEDFGYDDEPIATEQSQSRDQEAGLYCETIVRKFPSNYIIKQIACGSSFSVALDVAGIV